MSHGEDTDTLKEAPPVGDQPRRGPHRPPRRAKPSTADLIAGVLSGDRALLARAITLIESNRPEHHQQAQDVLQGVLPRTGDAVRVGITGVPGVGKSTFVEALGDHLVTAGHRVAVLAVDPTSSVRGGSILGDKTRMTTLAAHPSAFIRPSPTQGSLGGVHRKTRETMLLCEAAGFDTILVETVGVGQSETVVAQMVDTFLVLMLAGAGDELQGIKKGILEIVDVLAINKADGDNLTAARNARREYTRALHLIPPHDAPWTPPVLTCSGLHRDGVTQVWDTILAHRDTLTTTGHFQRRRAHQQTRWMWDLTEQELLAHLHTHPPLRTLAATLEQELLAHTTTPTRAAERLIEAFWGR